MCEDLSLREQLRGTLQRGRDRVEGIITNPDNLKQWPELSTPALDCYREGYKGYFSTKPLYVKYIHPEFF